MQKSKRFLMLALLSLFYSTLFHGFEVQAEAPKADSQKVLNEVKLVETPVSKLYRARVLLEDYRNWAEAYELLRDLLKNDDSIGPVPRKKIEKAMGQIKSYLPNRTFTKLANGRYVMRPFLEASYLLNEALMDSRVALNTSSDSEVIFVEQLLKSYFFPGRESQGEIIFPDYSTYAFDLFALTPENIAAARRERSDDPDLKAKANAGNAAKDAEPGIAQDIPKVDLDDQKLDHNFVSANGFIADLISSGVAVSEITKEVKSIIAKYEVPNRVNNRYLQTAMLMQAIVDPGSAVLDPQLQAFLKGVELKVALGQTENPSRSDLLALQQLMGKDAVVEKEGETRIRLGYLIDHQNQNPFLKSGFELGLKEVQGTGRSILYAISSVSGEGQMRLRTLQAAATLARDNDAMLALGAKVVGASSKLQWLQDFATVSLPKILQALPAAAEYVNSGVAAMNGGAIGNSLRVLSWGLKASVTFQNLTVTIASKLSPKALALISKLKDSEYVKNGTVTGVLTAAVAATQITVGVIEYRAATDDDQKQKIYVDTLSRVGGTVSYLLPVVGWGAAALDMGHAFLGVPFETADIFRGWGHLVGATTLWFMGTSYTDIEMTQLEAGLNIPREAIFFTGFAKRKNATVEACQESLARLKAETQGLALAELTFDYIGNRSFAAKTNYEFGARLEDHIRKFLDSRKVASEVEKTITAKLNTLLPAISH